MHWIGMIPLPFLYIKWVRSRAYDPTRVEDHSPENFSFVERDRPSRFAFYWKVIQRVVEQERSCGRLTLALRGLFFLLFTLPVPVGCMIAQCGTGASWLLCFSPASLHQNLLQLGLDKPLWQLYALAVYFGMINPVVEEIFWRVFVVQEFGCAFFGRRLDALGVDEDSRGVSRQLTETGAVNDVDEGSGFSDATREFRDDDDANCESTSASEAGDDDLPHPVGDTQGSRPARHTRLVGCADCKGACDSEPDAESLNGFVLTEVGSWICCGLYASYHVVVVWFMFHSIAWSVFGFAMLTILGRILLFCRTSPKLGIVTAVVLHVGVDLGAIISICAIFFRGTTSGASRVPR
eukprot:Polyplicarium_translucidae@DN2699_c0_g1_i1.p2